MNAKTSLETIKVAWFDNISGLGEGVTSKGEEVFLKWQNIDHEDKFLALQKDELTDCYILKVGNKLVAEKIRRKVAPTARPSDGVRVNDV